MLKFQKQWVKLELEYHLLVDTKGYACTAPCKKFRVYADGSPSIVELNKKIKENDLLEYLKTRLKRKDIQLIG